MAVETVKLEVDSRLFLPKEPELQPRCSGSEASSHERARDPGGFEYPAGVAPRSQRARAARLEVMHTARIHADKRGNHLAQLEDVRRVQAQTNGIFLLIERLESKSITRPRPRAAERSAG